MKNNENVITHSDILDDAESRYRDAYTKGYQQAIRDFTVYNVSKIQCKKFSVDELTKWKNFEDEFYDDFCEPPQARSYDVSARKKPSLKYLYFIRMVNDGIYYKIGITVNIKKRLETLQTGSPVPLEVVFKYRSLYAESIEEKLHKYFSHYNTSGEWFKIPEDTIRNFIEYDFQSFAKTIEIENNPPEPIGTNQD